RSRHDANRDVSGRSGFPWLRGWQRSARLRPGSRERPIQIRNRGPRDVDANVTPGLQIPGRIPDPRLADAQTGNEPALPVDGHHPARSSADPTMRAVEPRGIERPRFDAGAAQRFPQMPGTEGPRSDLQRAEPIAQEANAHTAPRPFGKRFRELKPDVVAV